MQGKSIRLQIVDVNGSEYYRNLLKFNYRNANGILLIYDISNKNTFRNLSKWFNHIDTNANEQTKICKVLVGNKIDISEREVTEEEGKKFADDYGLPYFEMSAKDNINVWPVFEFITNKILRYELNKID